MKIALGSDHAGFAYKEKIKAMLLGLGHDVKDFGTFTPDMVDYPLFIRPAAEAVASGACDRGIVLGGSGNGEAIVANKVHGRPLRALLERGDREGLPASTTTRTSSRSGERMIPEETALAIVRIFLETPFDPAAGGGRHARRIAMIE